MREAGAWAAPEGEADHLQRRGGAGRAPGVRCSRLRQALGEDAALAAGDRTEESAHMRFEPDAHAVPGQVRQRARVATVHAARAVPTGGARDRRAAGDGDHRDHLGRDDEAIECELRRGRTHRGSIHHTRTSDSRP